MSSDILRVVRRGKVKVDGHTYMSDELKPLEGKTVRISINVKTILEIAVYTLNDKFVCKAMKK